MNTIYGYARVSTVKQDLSSQVENLKRAGAVKIFKDKYTGTTANRPEFDKLMAKIKSGDTLIVTKLDRLARNTQDALNIVKKMNAEGVILRVLNIGTIDNSPSGRLIFTVFNFYFSVCYNNFRNMDAYMTLVMQSVGGLYDRFFVYNIYKEENPVLMGFSSWLF